MAEDTSTRPEAEDEPLAFAFEDRLDAVEKSMARIEAKVGALIGGEGMTTEERVPGVGFHRWEQERSPLDWFVSMMLVYQGTFRCPGSCPDDCPDLSAFLASIGERPATAEELGEYRCPLHDDDYETETQLGWIIGGYRFAHAADPAMYRRFIREHPEATDPMVWITLVMEAME